VVIHGGGSGAVQPPYIISPLHGIKNALGFPASSSADCFNGTCVYYADGSNSTAVVNLVKNANVAIVAIETSAVEGVDRLNLGWNIAQDALVNLTAANNPNTIVVGTCPGAVLTPWRNNVKAILLNFMPGQELGNALADVLFGDVNPSGHLVMTLPNKENEMNFTTRQYPGEDGGEQVYYDEKLNVGYRWYDSNNVNPAYEFGWGMSYTTFHYSNVSADNTGVTFTIQNTGSRDGAAVPQVYVGFPASAGEPPKQLKGFQKVNLPAGGSAQVRIPFNARTFSIWDVNSHAWSQVRGTFNVYLGNSSRDIQWTGAVKN